MRATMLHFFFFFSSSLSLLMHFPPLGAMPHSDPAPVHLLPPTAIPAASGGPPATIPAFPEQSDVSAASCPLDLPADLLSSVSSACAVSSGHVSRSGCCPALAATLYAAYSATALSAGALPAPSSAVPSGGYDLPALPDDSESCVAGVESALRARGVTLPRVNGSCDVSYCYCGVRLRRLTCAGAFSAEASQGRWVPAGDSRRRLERDCARPGLAGCTRCLRALNHLRARDRHGGNATRKAAGTHHDRECQLMGVTWLLTRNMALYLPAATSVLRVLMAADATGGPDPSSCVLSPDEMPFAVGSDQINGAAGSCFPPMSLLLSSASLVLLLLLSLEL